MLNQQSMKIKRNGWETTCFFPIGYVYMSSNNTSPGSIYGGTWSDIRGGRYMRMAGAWGNGGSNTISVQQMPSHSHIYVDKGQWANNVGGQCTAPSWGTQTSTNSGLYTSNTGGGATVLSNISKCICLVSSCLILTLAVM